MAKSQNTKIVVNCEPFSISKERLLERAERHWEREMLSRWVDYSPATRARNVPKAAPVITQAALDSAVAHLSTIRVAAKRNVATRCYDLTFNCVACGMKWTREIPDDWFVENRISCVLESAVKDVSYTHPETQSFGDRHWCSQCPQEERLYDGLTTRECLERIQKDQREDIGLFDRIMRIIGNPEPTLTPTQLAAARTAWSVELKKRQAAQREKERCAVTCEEQWGDEL